MTDCAHCQTGIDPSTAYYSDAGQMLCPRCHHREQIGLNETRLQQEGALEGAPGSGAASGDAFAPERFGISKGVAGGVVMMLLAVVWFVLGLMADTIFFYPPVLFCIGLYALIKGIARRNLAGLEEARTSSARL